MASVAANPFLESSADATNRAKRLSEERIAHYSRLLSQRKSDEQNFENSVVLKDGGRLLHLQTAEGSLMSLSNGNRWMFLERSGGRKVLYVCNVDSEGRQQLSQSIIQ